MTNIAVLHSPGTVDACPWGKDAIRLRLRAARGDVTRARVIYACPKHTWWQERRTAELARTFTDSEFDYFGGSVSLGGDTRFAYIFELTDRDGKLWYLSEEGLSPEYDHRFSYFNNFEYGCMFPEDRNPVPEWVLSAAAYQIFPERFRDGGAAKDRSYLTDAWGVKPTPKSFYGGDLVGIRQKLPYLRELGVSLLYMTPVFCAPSNHKYDTVDYENVDPMFGGNAALKALVDDAHAMGMRVMLDGVFNHCSSQHPFFQDVVKNGRKSRYYSWFFIDGEYPDEAKGNYQMFSSVSYMPKLNTANPEVIDYFTGVAVDWMKRCGVDAWRLDVADEISHRFLKAFRQRVTAYNPEAIVIGEDWHFCPRTLCGDEFDGVMNYGLTKACMDLLAFRTITPGQFRDRLVRLYHQQGEDVAAKMLNLLGSHDTDRFLTWCGGDKGLLRTAEAILFFYPGIPCVYYGDEVGMEGGYDPDCRRCFPWDESAWDRETRELVKKLMHMKKTTALAGGDFRLEEGAGILTFTRSKGNSTVVLTVNGTPEERGGLAPFGFAITEKREET